jgi:hypothetical protein
MYETMSTIGLISPSGLRESIEWRGWWEAVNVPAVEVCHQVKDLNLTHGPSNLSGVGSDRQNRHLTSLAGLGSPSCVAFSPRGATWQISITADLARAKILCR